MTERQPKAPKSVPGDAYAKMRERMFRELEEALEGARPAPPPGAMTLQELAGHLGFEKTRPGGHGRMQYPDALYRAVGSLVKSGKWQKVRVSHTVYYLPADEEEPRPTTAAGP